MRIRWYFTDLPFLDTPSIINSRDWDETPWVTYPVGELPNQPRTYNGANIVPGLNGEHQCGTVDQFAEGAPWPHTGAPVVYDRDWIPACCGREPVGQITTGSRLASAWSVRFATVTQFQTGAYPRAAVALVYPHMQRMQTGSRLGAAVAWSAQRETSTKTGSYPRAAVALVYPHMQRMQTGSRLGAAVAWRVAPEPSIRTGARPGAAVAWSTEREGTIATGARPGAAVAWRYPPPLAGLPTGARQAASVEWSAAPEPSISSGAELRATVTHTIVGPVEGIESGGSMVASHSYTPPPTPGTSCATAPTLTTGITYNFTSATGPAGVQWVKYSGITGLRSIACTALTGPTWLTQAHNGASCATLSGATNVTTNPQNFVVDLNGNLFIKITYNPVGTSSYTLKVT